MRHAKAVEHGEYDALIVGAAGRNADHARPLTPVGVQGAQDVCKQLNELRWQPTLVVGSDAVRVVDTVKSLKFPKPPQWIETPMFYMAGLSAIQKELTFKRVLAHQTIMVVGHNPGWSVAVEALTAQPVSLRTADAALLECEADNWNDGLLLVGTWTLTKVLSAHG
jgi:phosphohistidine phosphatase SixA